MNDDYLDAPLYAPSNAQVAAEKSAPAPDFYAAREAYETAQTRLLELIDKPRVYLTVGEYRAELKAAQKASQDAHNAWMQAVR